MPKSYFLFACALVAGLASHAARGQVVAPAAASATASISGTVQAERGNLLVGTIVVALHLPTGISRAAITDLTGNFKLDMLLPGGPYSIQITQDGYRSQVVSNVYLKAGQPVSLDFTLASATVATGTRRTDRTALDAAVPVDVIDMSALALTAPRTDNTQLLAYVVPSFNSNRDTSADGADHVDGFSLRGLGTDQTLVLVNGHRRHSSALITLLGSRGLGSSPTDLNTISANALDQVQVLRDGAAAQYGSDAIAGVINLTLKSANHGGNILLNNGLHQSGFGLNNTLSVNKGLKLGEKGFLNLTGEADYRGYTTSKNYDRDLNVWPVFSSDRATEDALLKASGRDYKYYRQRNGDAQMTNLRAVYNAAVPLSDKVRLYSFGTYNYRRGQAVAPWVLPSANPLDLGTRDGFRLGYQPGINTRIQDVAAVLGLEAKLGAWTLDLSQSIGHNRMQYDTDNTINPTLGNDRLNKFDAGGLRLTQAVSNATVSRFFSKALAGTNVAFGAEFRDDAYGIVAGEADSYADGKKGVRNPDGSPASTPGSQGFIGFNPTDASRNNSRQNTAGFLDVEADIVKGWTVNAAVRAEKYSNFKTTPTYKVASRVRVASWLAVRGAYNTGFRAPSLQQTTYEQLTLLPTAGGTTYSGIYNNTSAVAKAAGITPLEAETSKNISAGLVLQPTKQLTLTVDAYRIDIDNRISLTNTFVVADNDSLRKAFSKSNLDVESAQFFANALNTRTQGIDLVGTYNQPLGQGTLRLSAAANLNETSIRDDTKVPAVFKGTETDRIASNQFISQRQRSLIETGNPRNKMLASVGYEGNKLGLTVRYTRFGEVQLYDFNFDNNDEGSYRMKFSPTAVTDLILSYKPVGALQLALGVQNLLDTRPDDVITAAKQGQAPGGRTFAEYERDFPGLHQGRRSNLPSDRDILPYQQVQQGSNGRFFYLKASYSFGL